MIFFLGEMVLDFSYLLVVAYSCNSVFKCFSYFQDKIRVSFAVNKAVNVQF